MKKKSNTQEWLNAPMGKQLKPGWMQKLFKPYFVRRKNGQCQVLIPLVELDELCDRIESVYMGAE